MYLLSGDGKSIVNSEFVERFCVVPKDDFTLICASYSDTRPPVTIGRYESKGKALDVLLDLLFVLEENDAVFSMPALQSEQPVKRDARVKRKGAS